MNQNQIIKQLQRLSQLLDQGQAFVDAGNWDGVSKAFGEAEKIQDKIKTGKPGIDSLLEKNPDFKANYEPLKASLMEKTDGIISAIEVWKEQNTGKIADSKNTLDNISKFYKPSSTSYYIDRKE